MPLEDDDARTRLGVRTTGGGTPCDTLTLLGLPLEPQAPIFDSGSSPR